MIGGISITELKKINNPKGDIFHALKCSDESFKGFGEAYFTTVKHGEVKGWRRHNKVHMNLVVPVGEICFYFQEGSSISDASDSNHKFILSERRYNRITVSPGVWVAFEGLGKNKNLLMNIIELEHDDSEVDEHPFDRVKIES